MKQDYVSALTVEYAMQTNPKITFNELVEKFSAEDLLIDILNLKSVKHLLKEAPARNLWLLAQLPVEEQAEYLSAAKEMHPMEFMPTVESRLRELEPSFIY